MKNIVITLLAILSIYIVKAQDSLTVEQLKPLTYTFNIEDGKLVGKGAEFLTEAISQVQFTMLGEYHGSKRISEFTDAIIPILDNVGYKTMVLEVGPVSVDILKNLGSDVIAGLRSINNKYQFKDARTFTAIPFFSNVEDAQFLQSAKIKNWDFIGIDQEFIFSFQMLIDRMYNNLSDAQKSSNKYLYQQVTDSIVSYYKSDIDNNDFAKNIKNSEILKAFTSKMSEVSQNNEIVDALYASNHIYWLNATKKWFENNSTRITYMKSQLRKQLEQNNFDISKDKLLIKMGGYHTSKGFSPLGLYEVGNTLNEIAEYHGNKALNIGFSNRFYMEDGKLMDILESDNKWTKRTRDLDQMGEKNDWVVIDLRPMIKGHFYHPIKYKFNKHIKDLVKRYDLLIIPKTEMDPTPNYD